MSATINAGDTVRLTRAVSTHADPKRRYLETRRMAGQQAEVERYFDPARTYRVAHTFERGGHTWLAFLDEPRWCGRADWFLRVETEAVA